MEINYIITLCFGSGILVSVGKYILDRLKRADEKTEAVKLGLQALLRDRLIDIYNRSISLGYAPIYVRENFENMYNQYHALGANGVLNDLYEDFKKLPTREKEES